MPLPPLPYITVSPGTGNFGEAGAGTALTMVFTVRGVWPPGASGGINLSLSTPANPDFTVTVPLSVTTLLQGGPTSATFTVQALSAVPVVDTSSIQVSADVGFSGPITIALKATFVTANTGLEFTPPSLVFPQDLFLTLPLDTQTLSCKNTTAAPITITAITITDSQIALVTALPLTIGAGASSNLVFSCDHSILGIVSGMLGVVSSLGTQPVSTSASTIAFVGVDTITNTVKALIFSFAGVSFNAHVLDSTDFNGIENAVLIFNGALWNSPGNEKTLRRLEVYYENVGQCTGLSLTVSVWRPSLNPPGYDTKTQTIIIGDSSPDGSERSAFFDMNLAGEIIVITLQRTELSGPVSLLGFIPHFEDKGEKVEGV